MFIFNEQICIIPSLKPKHIIEINSNLYESFWLYKYNYRLSQQQQQQRY